MNKDFIWIDTDAELKALCERLSASTWLAFDTEFERVRTYYPEWCLLQVANEDETAIIDPLAMKQLTPIYDLLYDDGITKVFHSARQDLEIFFNIKDKVPAPIFDTQVAASYFNIADQISYAKLVEQTLSVELKKAYSRINWKLRPLKEEHLRYAADDVIYLGDVYLHFIQRVNQFDKESYSSLQQKMDVLSSSAIYQTDPNKMWKKINQARKLRGDKLILLKKLAAWRELTARKRNRPRKWLMADQIVFDIAAQMPLALEDLEKINNMDDKLLEHYGEELIKLVEPFSVAR